MDYDKLNKRLDHMFAFESDDFFVNINIKEDIADKLYDFQIFHVFNLITSMRTSNVVVDGSDTGTGKTYTSVGLCRQLYLKPFIICPKTVISNWKRVCDIFRIKPLAIVNYESIKNGKVHDSNGNPVDCKYIEIGENNGTITFKWKLPHNAIIIFDEVHRCKNPKSQNGQLLLSTKECKRVLMLSATLTDKMECFKLFGYMLNCYKTLKQSNAWIKGMLLEDNTCVNFKRELSAVNKAIYPDKGSRMRIKDLGDKFPSNQISADTYLIDDANREIINKAFKKFQENDLSLKSASENISGIQILGEITKARQLLELIKVSIIVELTNEYIENGYNVVIFVNYTNTIRKLSTLLKTKCIVDGTRTIDERIENVQMFQDNKCNVIICNVGISEGINLHDLYGVPRVSLISPPFSSVQLVQALGRIARVGSQTPALQRIIYCADTCEEIICNKLKDKLKFLSKLNDNDLVNIE